MALLLKSGLNQKRGKIFSPCSQKCQPPPKKNFLEETFTFFSLVFSSHLLPFLLRRILVYTPVYIIKPPHEDANFHTGFISNNFKKMSTTTANPPASAAATKGTRDEFCVFTLTHRNNLRVLSVHFYAAKLFFSFSATERRERCGDENERFDRK